MAGDSVRQIKERLTIVDVVAPYVELSPAGKHMKARCPFHSEKTPSFTISPDRGMYYCYGCSKGGDIFNFIEEIEGVDFKGALQMLADKAGVELVPEDPKKKTERDRQYDILNEATDFFANYLNKKQAAKDYLKDRGVTSETIAKWRIGYAPGPPDHGWREGKEYLEGKQFKKEEIFKAGLIKGLDTGKEPYDLFRDRIMFPIFDTAGKVVAYSGRILTKDTEAPKYVNSPDTELFNKSEILYGYDKAKQGIRTMDFSLIVEGQFDVVMTHQAGYHNAVAVSGTALTAYHVMLLQRLSNRVVLALDADRAGIAAVKRAAELMLSRGMDVKVAHMPDGEDPADIIQKDKAEFKKIIGNSTHVIEYLLDVLEAQNHDDRTFKLKAREEILPYVVKIPNRIDQEHFEVIIADRLKTTKDAIHFEVERIAENNKANANTGEKVTPAPTTNKSNMEVSFDRLKEVEKYLLVLSDLLPQREGGLVRDALKDMTEQDSSTLRDSFDQADLSKVTFELEARMGDKIIKEDIQDVVDKLNELNTLLTKTRLRNQMEILKVAETEQSEEKTQSVLEKITVLQKCLGEMKYSPEMFENS